MIIHQFETDEPCDLARKLIAEGKAFRDDRLETLRNGKPALGGSIGWFADHTVRENATASPTFVKWRPFPDARRRSGTASAIAEAL